MGFVQAVRDGLVKHPTQRGFALSRWQASYASSADHSQQASDLAAAGEWTFRSLNCIRDQLRSLPALPNPDEHIRLLAAAANYLLLTVSEQVRDELENSPFIVLGASGGHLDEQMESLLDGLRYPLSVALQGEQQTSDGDRRSDREVLAGVGGRIALGLAYDTTEDLWGRCLWEAWRIQEIRPNEVLFLPPDEEREVAHAVNVFRYLSTRSELAMGFESLCQGLHPPHNRHPARVFAGVSRKGRRKRFTLAEPPPWPSQQETYRFVAEELYLKKSLDSPLPNFDGLTAGQILDAWAAIAPLAIHLQEKCPRGQLDSVSGLLHCAPVLPAAELARALGEALEVGTKLAEKLIDVLSTKATARQELWFNPIVPVEGGVSLLAPALISPNLLRSIEEWLRVGGADLSERGPEFEDYVRELLLHSNSLSNAYIHGQSITTDEAVGDIDLFVRLGSTTLVAELKCSLYPASPLERFKYESIMKGAAGQAATKARFVEERWEVVAAQLKQPEIPKPGRVIPLVVSNLSLATGQRFLNVAAVDVQVLVKYFGDGYLDSGLIDAAGVLRPAGERVHFYGDATDAEHRLEAYLESPPSFRRLVPLVAVNDRPLFELGGSRVSMRATTIPEQSLQRWAGQLAPEQPTAEESWRSPRTDHPCSPSTD